MIPELPEHRPTDLPIMGQVIQPARGRRSAGWGWGMTMGALTCSIQRTGL